MACGDYPDYRLCGHMFGAGGIGKPIRVSASDINLAQQPEQPQIELRPEVHKLRQTLGMIAEWTNPDNVDSFGSENIRRLHNWACEGLGRPRPSDADWRTARLPVDYEKEALRDGVQKLETALNLIARRVSPDEPGVYEWTTLAYVHRVASNALGRATFSPNKWNKPRDPHAPMAMDPHCASNRPANWYEPKQSAPYKTQILYFELQEALACLSGDLNYDNVAKAKEILKKML